MIFINVDAGLSWFDGGKAHGGKDSLACGGVCRRREKSKQSCSCVVVYFLLDGACVLQERTGRKILELDKDRIKGEIDLSACNGLICSDGEIGGGLVAV